MIHQLINSSVAHYSGIIYRGDTFAAHFHNSYELIRVLSGRADVTVGGRTITLSAEEYLLISPCAVHELRGGADAAYFVAIIAPDHITDYAETHKNDIAVRFRLDADADALIRARLIDADCASVYGRKACFYLLLSFAEQGEVLLRADQYDISFVYAVNSYIAEHFTEPLRRQELAQMMGYEPHYFSSLFRKNFGMGIRKYLNIYRISHACRLLRTTDSTISAIAFASGFSGVRDFNAVFAELLGMTPTGYRGG
ncbi:MAG: AraC family transcriptional regulator [Clostridia bacterium]|nr:AraC family transcriptional regulator [Clostridia bacterium]